MSHLHEKVSYLKGLLEGFDIKPASKEGRIYSLIIELLEEISDELDAVYDEIDELEQNSLDLEEYVEAIDEDLDSLETFIEEEFDLDVDDDAFEEYDLEEECDCEEEESDSCCGVEGCGCHSKTDAE